MVSFIGVNKEKCPTDTFKSTGMIAMVMFDNNHSKF